VTRPGRVRERLGAAAEFARDEALGGAVLLAATLAALLWANLGDSYESLWTTELTLGGGSLSITEDLRHWINDGLMAVFFFVVALEVKRELAVGELSDPRVAALPVLGALGGAALPAAIFVAISVAGGGSASGWAIPTATDIAFAVGVLAVLSRWVPAAVRLLLLTIAVVDDIVAIVVIALFYGSGISLPWAAAVAAGLAAIVALRMLGVRRIAAYVPLGIAVWIAMLESGVHATIAGVAVGLLTPARPLDGKPVLEQLEERLHPISAVVVVPLFALANAGIAFGGDMLADAASSSVAWAIAVALVVGKPLGIAGTILALVRLRVGSLPDGIRAPHLWGMAALGGIGFTVSLFIAQLAYDDAVTIDAAKLGVFAGSIVSAALGVAILLAARRL
jgi:Na+:H+ antiporter, NhaA family